MFRAVAVAVSTRGVRILVSARPVPDIQKLLLACWEAFWFWMPVLEVSGILVHVASWLLPF